ncbi:MAG: CBS domain-containing protein [Nitrospinota bacterium]
MVVKVKDVMVNDVVTVDAMAPLVDALELMFAKSVKSLVILPRNEHDAFGILTFRDIARKVIAGNEQIDMLNVFDLMNKPCYNVHEELDIRYAAKKMTDMSVSRLLVTRGNTLVGIVSLTDLVKSLVKNNS